MDKRKQDLASRLRHRITLEQPVTSTNGGGGYEYTWVKYTDLWADIIPQRSTELLLGEQLVELKTYEVVIRYNRDINPNMRVKFSGRVFNIKNIWHERENGKSTKIIMHEDIFV